MVTTADWTMWTTPQAAAKAVEAFRSRGSPLVPFKYKSEDANGDCCRQLVATRGSWCPLPLLTARTYAHSRVGRLWKSSLVLLRKIASIQGR